MLRSLVGSEMCIRDRYYREAFINNTKGVVYGQKQLELRLLKNGLDINNYTQTQVEYCLCFCPIASWEMKRVLNTVYMANTYIDLMHPSIPSLYGWKKHVIHIDKSFCVHMWNEMRRKMPEKNHQLWTQWLEINIAFQNAEKI